MLNNGEQQNEKERFDEKQKGLNMSTSFAGSRDEYKASFVMEERRMCTSHVVVQGDAGVYFEVYRDYKREKGTDSGRSAIARIGVEINLSRRRGDGKSHSKLGNRPVIYNTALLALFHVV